MDKNHIKRITLNMKEFKENNMKCPYLENNRCIIYPVRPLVCRLQGNIDELKCRISKNLNPLSIKELDEIKYEFFELLKKVNCLNFF